jgi:Epoxide hydrolase N terminus
MDPNPHIWFHALKEIVMNPVERLTLRVSFGGGIIVVAAIVLSVSSMSAGRPGPVFRAASIAGAAPAAVTRSAEPSGAAIRPFRVNVPKAELDELRRRVLATRWPDKETVPDQSQGVQLAKLQELVRYWGTGYDWRKVEAKLNALPQVTTNIEGVDIHFIHVRSRHRNALPVIMTHGWPGSRSPSFIKCFVNSPHHDQSDLHAHRGNLKRQAA